jgi:RNA polymerase sigma-70 factor, ECF subfamily
MGEGARVSGNARTAETRSGDDMPQPGTVDDAEQSPEECPSIDRLVAEHHESLYRYAFRLVGDQPDAEDLVQQTFLMAQQRMHQLREPCRARSWLFAVMRSLFLKDCRRTTPVNASSVDAVPEEWMAKSDGEPDLDLEQLQLALGEIPDESRVILMMFYFEQASYKEIAEQLELKMGTVMSRLARAKEKLRERLSQRMISPSHQEK